MVTSSSSPSGRYPAKRFTRRAVHDLDDLEASLPLDEMLLSLIHISEVQPVVKKKKTQAKNKRKRPVRRKTKTVEKIKKRTAERNRKRTVLLRAAVHHPAPLAKPNLREKNAHGRLHRHDHSHRVQRWRGAPALLGR